jgi:hypothetical protein
MLDRLALPLIVLTAACVIALAMVWPQGYGARSPGPFGHTPIQQTPEMKAALRREHDKAMRAAEAPKPPPATPDAAPAPVPAAPAPEAAPALRPALGTDQ